MVTAGALLVAVAALCTSLALARAVRSQQRAHERENARLIDQICHLAGRTWGLPPRDLTPVPVPVDSVLDDGSYDL